MGLTLPALLHVVGERAKRLVYTYIGRKRKEEIASH